MSIEFLKSPADLIEQILTPLASQDDEDDDPLAGLHDGKRNALRQLPKGAREVASFQTDVNHSPGLTWHIDLTLFVVAIPSNENAFALLCLDWNDNWGRWEWLCEHAVGGASSKGEATASLLGAYRASMIDVAQGDFLEFIASL
jgi:hypothetical protein